LAVKPEYAEALLEGRKGMEFRRVRPSFSEGSFVYVYSSAPVQAVVGWFLCGTVVDGCPETLWRRFRDSAGLTRSRFFSYFRGARRGSAIEVRSPQAWELPLELREIRVHVPHFSPPQSYVFLNSSDSLLRLLVRHDGNRTRKRQALA